MYVLVIIILLQFAATAFFVFSFKLTRSDADNLSAKSFGNLIITTIDGLNRPVNQDAQSGIVYLHETRLTLPAVTDRSLQLLYDYESAGKDTAERLHLIDALALRTAKSKLYSAQNHDELFAAVPKLQACVRGYSVVFAPVKDGGDLVFQKQLKDRRQVYVYHEAKCPINKDMTDYLNKLDSY